MLSVTPTLNHSDARGLRGWGRGWRYSYNQRFKTKSLETQEREGRKEGRKRTERLGEGGGGKERGSGRRKGSRMRGKEEWDEKLRQMLETYPLLSVCNSKYSYWRQWFIVNRKRREKDTCDHEHIEYQS